MLMHLVVMMMGILKMMVFLMMNLLMSSGRVRLKPNEFFVNFDTRLIDFNSISFYI